VDLLIDDFNAIGKERGSGGLAAIPCVAFSD
jgi:hypothetical protein